MRALALIALASSSCASLNTGWAKVTWLDGAVSPVVSCSARVNAEGDVEMTCTRLNELEADLLWKREKRRSTGGDT